MELKEQLEALIAEQKAFVAKANEEIKSHGAALTDTKSKLDAIQRQMDALDAKQQRPDPGTERKSLEITLKENEDIQRLLRDRKGQCVFTLKGDQLDELMGRKTLIDSTAVGFATSGVLQIDRGAGIVAEARRKLTIRQMLNARPTSMQVIDFVKVNAALDAPASPTPGEGLEKDENAVTFTTQSEKVRTLATWIPASRQILDDFGELMGFLRAGLPYYVNVLEENELLTGDGSGEHLHGLTHQAQSYDTTLTPAGAGWQKVDIIGRAVQQIAADNEVEPTFVALNPNDFWDIRLTKDENGQYIFGPPNSPGPVNFFGLTPVPTTAMTATYFLVGSGLPVASEIRDRMEMEIAISTEHSDYFTKNKIAIRAEKRMALVVYRPNSYVYGAFTTSPA